MSIERIVLFHLIVKAIYHFCSRSYYSLAVYCHIPKQGTFTGTAVKTSKIAKKCLSCSQVNVYKHKIFVSFCTNSRRQILHLWIVRKVFCQFVSNVTPTCGSYRPMLLYWDVTVFHFIKTLMLHENCGDWVFWDVMLPHLSGSECLEGSWCIWHSCVPRVNMCWKSPWLSF
jgi:hypothetical protein